MGIITHQTITTEMVVIGEMTDIITAMTFIITMIREDHIIMAMAERKYL
jgi:hypothetical protein